MHHPDPASSAEGSSPFVTTQWTNVLLARENSASALEALCATYRPALVNWLRGRGETLHDAEDLVQGFFAQLLRREFLTNVGREKGRFRAFLLRALQNHLIDEHRRRAAVKRGDGQLPVSLDETTEDGKPMREPISFAETPDETFDRAWAQELLAQALRNLEHECNRKGHIRLCLALEPVLFADADAPAYAQIATELGMTEAAVKMAALRLRQRLKALIRSEVLATVSDESQLDEELGYLKRLFSKRTA